jgi:hypothetical protein
MMMMMMMMMMTTMVLGTGKGPGRWRDDSALPYHVRFGGNRPLTTGLACSAISTSSYATCRRAP